jgi:hypothetical protein
MLQNETLTLAQRIEIFVEVLNNLKGLERLDRINADLMASASGAFVGSRWIMWAAWPREADPNTVQTHGILLKDNPPS